MASKFLFASLRCKLYYQLQFLTMLRKLRQKVKSKVEIFSLTFYRRPNMAKAHISPADNAANISNANKGTSGQNLQRTQNQGNRGWQMNPQNPANKSSSSSKKR